MSSSMGQKLIGVQYMCAVAPSMALVGHILSEVLLLDLVGKLTYCAIMVYR